MVSTSCRLICPNFFLLNPVVTSCTTRFDSKKNSTFCPHAEQTAITFIYSAGGLVCISETECVYCAVRTGSLTVIYLYCSLLQSHFIPPAYEDGTDKVFRNVGIYNSDAGEIPKRKHNIFRTRRKFEIENKIYLCSTVLCNTQKFFVIEPTQRG